MIKQEGKNLVSQKGKGLTCMISNLVYLLEIKNQIKIKNNHAIKTLGGTQGSHQAQHH
jgi:hypothetical protein